ncbi:transposase [Saltatorellus ferox]|uniref:transposase n=1 Tax=Saltatorellus ferox TaxID=2528018 RepID=UPI003AF3F797
MAHVTIKLKRGFRSLRKKEEMAVLRAAIARVNQGELVRIVEFSVMSNHVHLIVEAENSGDLSKGMASLNTGLGMRLNRLWGRVRRGSVFAERFHLEVITSPTQMRNVLKYVLRNDVHHGLGLGILDPCSSAMSFGGFVERRGASKVDCVSVEAQSWLLRVGWTKGGGKGLLTIHDLPRVTGALQA